MIEWDNTEIIIKHQCELLDLPHSTAYHVPVPLKSSEDEINIKNAIDRIHYKEPSKGVRRIKNDLHRLGYNSVGRRLVKRYMQEMDIYAFYPGPNLSKRVRAAKLYPYLLKNLVINRANQVWSIDITYIGTPSGFVYLTAIIDWHSCFIVGYTISNSLQADMVTRTIKKAVERYGAPEIINSDQGSQFNSTEYIELIKSYKTTRNSMDGKGRATDNIAIERFFRPCKWERVYLMYPETIQDVKDITNEYMETYNYDRGHQRHNYHAPSDIYFDISNQVAA